MSKRLYDKSVREIFHEMVADMGLKKGDRLSRNAVLQWFARNYSKVKNGTINAHLILHSTNAPSRIHHPIRPEIDDLLYQIDGSTFRLYDPSNDPEPIRKGVPGSSQGIGDDTDREQDEGDGAFAYEKDLQNYLARNLEQIEPGLRLYEDEDIQGIEFPVGGRFIDILAVDKDGNLVVIELKVSKGYDRVVGQILRYISWIKKNHADEGQKVRGIIIAREISEDLLLACADIPNVSLMEYTLSVSLKKVE